MHASVVTNVGIVVDAFIIERCVDEAEIANICPTSPPPRTASSSAPLSSFKNIAEASRHHSLVSPPGAARLSRATASFSHAFSPSIPFDDVHYECVAVGRPLLQRIFHVFDVLPFGFECPSSVFSVVGRHTNRGLVLGVTDDGLFIISPYASGPLQLTARESDGPCVSAEALEEIARVSASPAVQSARALFFEKAARLREARRDAANAESMGNSVTQASTGSKPHKARGPSESPDAHDRIVNFELENEAPLHSTSSYHTSTGNHNSNNPNNQHHTNNHHNHNHHNSNNNSNSNNNNPTNPPNANGSAADSLFDGCERWALKDLQLPPALARHGPVAPLRVGSRVLARRFGCGAALYTARVVAARYDVTYALRFDCDGRTDRGVLHGDLHLLDDAAAEPCAVRDRVTVALLKQLPAVVVECVGAEEYRVVLESSPDQPLTVARRHIVFVAPLLKEALYANPLFVEWFRALDPTHSGYVPWKEVRRAIMEWETFGQPLSLQKIGEIQRDLCIHMRRVKPQLLRKMPIQVEEMLLRYPEFEYVIQRIRNVI